MSGNDYLKELLESQEMKEGCQEFLDLDAVRDAIEKDLNTAYPDSELTFTHGGSRAKGTMIREDYDLDLICYFGNEDTSAGETLEDIYNNVGKLLDKSYSVFRKRSALRLHNADGRDVKVDVVPGRYTDNTKTDVFLHQNEGNKERLKTNPEIQIGFIRDSGCTDIIKLAKLWRTRNGVQIKTFPLELLVIEVLNGQNSGDLEARAQRVLNAFAKDIDNLTIEDPANPTGNDLSYCLTDKLREEMSTVARDTLEAVEKNGWPHVFGDIAKSQKAAHKVTTLKAMAAVAPSQIQPWSCEG